MKLGKTISILNIEIINDIIIQYLLPFAVMSDTPISPTFTYIIFIEKEFGEFYLNEAYDYESVLTD